MIPGVLYIGHNLINAISCHYYSNTHNFKNDGHIIKENVQFYLEFEDEFKS